MFKQFRFVIGILLVVIAVQYKVYAQVERVVTYYDKDLKMVKETYYIAKNINTILQGPYVSYYLSGGVKSKGNYQNNIPSGFWEYFYENGNHKMKGTLIDGANAGEWFYYYENGKPSMHGGILKENKEGSWSYYFENGGIKSAGNYKRNEKEGIWNYYYEDGSLKAQAFYTKSVGPYKEFYHGGQLKMEGWIKHNESDSLWTLYYESGAKQAEGAYINGSKNGTWKYYYPNGVVSAQGHYSKGQTDGKWMYYYRNGKLSSEGVEREGLKEGYWRLYKEDGTFKGEGVFAKGSGEFKEFYDNGILKSVGKVANGHNEGKWYYYAEDGKVEGECDFIAGEGQYIGYYNDGSIKMRGPIKNNVRIGTWELYSLDGSLAGYYKPYYEDSKPVFKLTQKLNDADSLPAQQPYQKPDYRYKARKLTNFDKRLTEFKGIIVSANPANILIGSVPISVENYVQERIGHELIVSYIRSPFFVSNDRVDLYNSFKRGYSMALRQKLYRKDQDYGMIYLGHELRYGYFNHYVNILSTPLQRTQLNAQSNQVEYSIIVGDRILRDASSKGITADLFASLGVGYRFWNARYPANPDYDQLFGNVATNPFFISPRIGFTVGYIFNITKY